MNPRILTLLMRVAAYLKQSLEYVDDRETAELYAEVLEALEGGTA